MGIGTANEIKAMTDTVKGNPRLSGHLLLVSKVLW